MKKKSNNESKPSQLGNPLRNNRIFTYSENQLLDQITREITSAWQKDLIAMRKLHEETKATYDSIKNLAEHGNKTFKKLNDFIEKSDSIKDLINFSKKISDFFYYQNKRGEYLSNDILEFLKNKPSRFKAFFKKWIKKQ